jgi:hypothetical protein
MKERIVMALETVLGATWWGGVRLWGVLLTAALVLAPLLLGNLAAELVETLPATPALALGVIGAYGLGLPPWDAEEQVGLPLLIGGAASSAVAWDLIRGSADVVTLLVALSLTLIGWPIRRALSRRSSAWSVGSS